MSEPLSIAVVGVSALLPGSTELGGFWRDLLAGRDLLTDVPPTHWLAQDHYDPDPAAPDRTYSKRGAFLPEVAFDPLEFGLPPSTLPATDTSQLMALIVAQRVLEDATAGQFSKLNRDRASVILGVTGAQGLLINISKRLEEGVWRKSLREAGVGPEEAERVCQRIKQHYVPWQEATFPGLLGNVVAGRIANRFDLRGTNCVTDAACASSLAALAMAVSELVRGQSDLVITGGVDCLNDPLMYMCFSKTPALSRTGDCRPFDEKADGTMLGEGLAMFALRRLADAERDGDRIYAVLRGLGSASDGRSKSVYAPLPEGQARALTRAYEEAGYSPQSVELVEAHGTGTKAGDVAEFEGLRQVFDRPGAPRQACALGSVKSQIGHTKAAAGAAGLLKVVLALHHKVLPPTIKVDKPNPALRLEESPFYLNTRARPWVRGDEQPRRASVSAFGFGGSNFHLTAEEYRGPAPRPVRLRGAPSELVLLSAASGEELARACEALAAEAGPQARLDHLAYRSQRAPAQGPARLAVVAESIAQLAERLRRAAGLAREKLGAQGAVSEPGLWMANGAQPGRVAFLFPGQGSQYVGMGCDLAVAFDDARRVWDEAAASGLHRVVFPPPAFDEEGRARQLAALTATDRAQPAIGLASLALLRVLGRAGLQPDCVGGHSFGELTGLHAAGVLRGEDFLRAAQKRGELMAAAATAPGTMTAVSARVERVRSLLEGWALPVVVANHNHPEQVVLSGPTEAIGEAERRLGAEGLAFRRLQVATAFHSPLVASASVGFGAFLEGLPLGAPRLEAYSNSLAAPYPADAAQARKLLAGQLERPVRFVEQVEAMYASGVRTFVEVGPSAVLTELVGRTLAGRPHRAVALDRKGKHGATALWEALGQLWVGGLAMEPARLWEGQALPEDPAARKPPKLAVPISGTNYGKPYPPPPGQAMPPIEPPRKDSPMPPRPTAPAASPAPAAPPVAEAPAPIPALAEAPADVSLAWVAAFQEAQRQTADAHASYQQAMADSHAAFLRSMEVSFQSLSTMLGGRETLPPLPDAQALPVPRPLRNAPPPPAPPPPVPPAPPPAQAEAGGPSRDLSALVLKVVAETTGYPAEMLGMQMDLEADLGIDSIKRVEILSAVRDRAPELPEVKPNELAALKTLGQIIDHLGAQGVAAAPRPAAPAKAPTPAPAAKPGRDLVALVLEVVAATTGYPADMLGMQMDLEADLGIDSIKRVEILSAVRDRAPDLPEVKPNQLAALKTLGQIVEQLRGGGSPTPAEREPARSEPAPQAPRGQRLLVEAVDAPLPGLISPGLEAGLVVTDDGAGVAAALVERLGRRGIAARVVASVPQGAKAVVFLGGLRPVETEAQALAVNREAFAAAQSFAREGGAGLLAVVQDTGGDFGLSGRSGPRAWLAGLAGLARTAGLECPEATVRAIDLERGGRSPDAVAEALERELLQGGQTREVGLSAAGRRVTLRDRAQPAEAGQLPLDERSVVVATGGARGVTAAGLVALARATRARFALLGRTPRVDEPAELRDCEDEAALKRALLERARRAGRPALPAELGAEAQRILAGREIAQTLEALQQAGSEALYLQADATDPEALGRALAEVRRRLGPVTAVVHGAGVLADKRLAEKTPEQFNRVFDTKVLGLRALLEATREDPLSVLCLFSSVAARTGNAGQADYAMANEVLHAVAAAERRRRGAGCRVVSIGWGPWEGGMVTPALRAHFEQRGVGLLPLEDGARMLLEELATPAPDAAQVLVGSALVAPGRTVNACLEVGPASYPHLEGHRLEGAVVVPVVQVIEWFARAARAARPDLRLGALRALKVNRGIRLPVFAEPGETFQVRGREAPAPDGAGLALELVGPTGAVHYLASAELTSSPPPAPAEWARPRLEAWSGSRIYDGVVLFHRPPFQAVRSIAGVSEEGLSGSLQGTLALGWPDEPWATDPAALDGVLQLAVVWASRLLGGPCLPTGVGEVLFHGELPSAGPLECVVRRSAVHTERASCEARLYGEGGRLLVELKGIELHLRPEGTRAASRPGPVEAR